MQLRGQYAVHFHKDGVLHSFLPGDEVPEWAAELITNPHAWGTLDDEPEPQQVDITVGAGGEGGHAGVPSKSGVGSSRQAWADYAESKGVEVDPDWKREDIIAAVENAES